MKQALMILVICGFLTFPAEFVGLQGTGEMERIAVLRLPVPAMVHMPAGISYLNVAVDELGSIYASFSVWEATQDRRGRTNSAPYLIKYDSTGRIIRTFRPPDFLSGDTETARITSIAYRDRRIYASILWRDRTWHSGILVFDSVGELERIISLDDFEASKVHPGEGGVIYVLGAPMRKAVSGSPMILKLSPQGERIASFSPVVGKTSKEVTSGLQSLRQNELTLDESGRVFHILPDGEVRIFDANGTLIKALRKEGVGRVLSAFWDGENIVMNSVEEGSGRILRLLLSERDQPRETEIGSQLPPMFKGADGYYYGFGHLGVLPDSSATQLEFLVAKFRKIQ